MVNVPEDKVFIRDLTEDYEEVCNITYDLYNGQVTMHENRTVRLKTNPCAVCNTPGARPYAVTNRGIKDYCEHCIGEIVREETNALEAVPPYDTDCPGYEDLEKIIDDQLEAGYTGGADPIRVTVPEDTTTHAMDTVLKRFTAWDAKYIMSGDFTQYFFTPK